MIVRFVWCYSYLLVSETPSETFEPRTIHHVQRSVGAAKVGRTGFCALFFFCCICCNVTCVISYTVSYTTQVPA